MDPPGCRHMNSTFCINSNLLIARLRHIFSIVKSVLKRICDELCNIMYIFIFLGYPIHSLKKIWGEGPKLDSFGVIFT